MPSIGRLLTVHGPTRLGYQKSRGRDGYFLHTPGRISEQHVSLLSAKNPAAQRTVPRWPVVGARLTPWVDIFYTAALPVGWLQTIAHEKKAAAKNNPARHAMVARPKEAS